MFRVSLILRLGRRVRVLFLIAGFNVVSFPAFGSGSGFRSVAATPYDHQMSRIEPVLNVRGSQSAGAMMSQLPVALWMTELRALPYQYSQVWQTPAEVSLTQASDCKGKAVALYAEMRRNGAQNLRVVIGKRHLYDGATHAWLEWDTMAGRLVLDPTFNERPVRSAELDPATYVAFYAFDGDHKYRAMTAANMVASTTTTNRTTMAAPASGSRVAVATRSGSMMASPTRSNVTVRNAAVISVRRAHAVPPTLNSPAVLNAPPPWMQVQW